MRCRDVLMLALATFGSAALQAQDGGSTVLWRAKSFVSPTLLPAYGGQPSPFIRAIVEDVTATLEVEAQRIARMRAMQEAESVLNGPSALVPNLSGLNFAGHLSGEHGVKVFFNNMWIGLNSQLTAPMEVSNNAYKALDILKQQDVQAAEELSRRLQERLNQHGPLKLTLEEINDTSVILKSTKESYQIPLQRSGL